MGDAADLLGVHYDTIRRWEDTGLLTGYRTPGGHRRYAITDLENMLTKVSDSALLLDDESAGQANDAGAA